MICEPIVQNFIFPLIFSLIFGWIVSLIIIAPVRRLKSAQAILVVIIMGILLGLFAFLSPAITEVGGAFYEASGRSSIPNGLPLSFFRPDPSWVHLRGPNGEVAVGAQAPLKFYPIPFVIDIIFWIAFAMIIIFIRRAYCLSKS